VAADRHIGGQGESLVRITLPPETPEEARIAVRRLVELTTILARRCDQLQEALDSRIVIEQAKGVLSARLDLSVDQSFDLLRRAARTHRLSLRDLAAEVVESDTVPPKIACMVFGAEVGHSRDPGATRKVSRAG
jgi:hypothetical protein